MRTLILAAAIATIACATTQTRPISKYTGKEGAVFVEDTLRDQASFSLGCPAQELDVKELGEVTTAGVSGCGKKAIYKWESHSGTWIDNTISQ